MAETISGKRLRWRGVALVLLLLALGALYFSLSYNGVLFASDEGATAYHFEKAAEGAIQHRDFFSVYGMAFYVLGKYLFNLFGFSLIVTRNFMLALKLGMAVLIFFIALRLIRPGFAFLSSLGFIVWWGDPFIATTSYLYPSHISQFFGLVSLLCMVSYLRVNRKGLVLLGGMAAGVNSLFKPTAGVLSLLALLIFFFAREMLNDITDSGAGASVDEPSGEVSSGKLWIAAELIAFMGVMAIIFAMFAHLGVDFFIFLFFLLSVCIVAAYLFYLAFSIFQTSIDASVFRRNFREAATAYALLVGGVVFWQLVQLAYFAGHGALQDFFRTYSRATAYYSEFAITIWQGPTVAIVCGLTLVVVLGLYAAARLAENSNKLRKIVGVAAMAFAAVVPVCWYLRLDALVRHHYVMWSASLVLALLLSLLYVWKNSLKRIKGEETPGLPFLLLLTVYSVVNLLDAYPRVDPGHFFMVMPPVFVLFGFLAERFFDFWKSYLEPAVSRAAAPLAGAITGLLALGVALPSLFMMVMFQILIVPTANGYELPQGGLRLVPRVQPAIERAKGLKIHVLNDHYWQPLVLPQHLDFFDVVQSVRSVTRKGDTVFCTTSWSFMLYFLTDRDCIEDKANSYVWQTVMGISTNEAMEHFSDEDLIRLIDKKKPEVIVAEQDGVEMQMFVANWPQTWDYIRGHYRAWKRVGSFLIYVPRSGLARVTAQGPRVSATRLSCEFLTI